LPEEYACPECGLRYDALSATKRPRDLLLSLKDNSRWLLLIFFSTVGVTAIFVWMVRTYAPEGTGIKPTGTQETVLWLLLGACATCWLSMLALIIVCINRYRRGRLVVSATPDGLYWRLDALPGRLYPWHREAEVTILTFAGMLMIWTLRTPGRRSVSVLHCFDDFEDAEAFAGIAREYIRRTGESMFGAS